MNNEQARFIDRLYKDLYLDETVIRYGSGNKYDKFNNIISYIQKLAYIHNSVSDTGRHKEMLRKMYYDKYVIKPEDIPESYYEHQQEIALERGYGHVEMTEYIKKQYKEQIINDQKASLDVWLDYFLSEDAKVYPFWAKYWAFQGMLKLGNYDKEKGVFGKRTKDTVAPFVDLNREALAMSIDVVIKMFNNEKIDDKKLESLVKNGSFPKIYAYILNNVLTNNSNITKKDEGKWVKYLRYSDHIPLVKSLQGYNTGWCTAGESTAKIQISMGDFYVYYTLDDNDEYKVPRIAIRMESNGIAEIRGIATDQNIEPEMEKVLEEKLKEFSNKDKYLKRYNDMKQLTTIYKKHKNKEELTVEELKFLYEVDYKIENFGYRRDPRIQEIKSERKANDLNKIFKNVDKFEDDLDLNDLTSVEDLVLPRIICGNLRLSGVTSAKGLRLPQSIDGDLDLSGLTSAENLILPQNIGGRLDLRRIPIAKGLVFPQTIGGDLNLLDITNAEGLTLPQSIGGSLYFSSAKNVEGLVLPESIGGDLLFKNLENGSSLTLPQSIGGNLYAPMLTNAEGLVLPKHVGGFVLLTSLTSANDLILPIPLTYKIQMRNFEITPENVDEYRNKQNTHKKKVVF